MKDKFLLFLQIFFNFCRIVTTFLRLLSNIHKCLMDKHFLHKSLLHKLFLHKRLLDKLLLDKLFLDKYYRHKNFLTEISLTHIDSGHVKLDTNVSDRNFLTHLVLTVLWYSHLGDLTRPLEDLKMIGPIFVTDIFTDSQNFFELDIRCTSAKCLITVFQLLEKLRLKFTPV